MLSNCSRSAALVVAMLAATGAVTALSEREAPAGLAQPLDSLPREIAGWKWSADEVLAPDVLAMLKPTNYLSRSYEKSGKLLGLFIAYYAVQRAGETMHSPRHCLPGNGWDMVHQSTLRLSAGGQVVIVNDDLIRRLGHEHLMLYWYQSRRRIFASEFEGKFLLLKDAILEGRTEGSLVRIVLPNAPGMKAEAISFAQELIPNLQRCLGK